MDQNAVMIDQNTVMMDSNSVNSVNSVAHAVVVVVARADVVNVVMMQ